MTGVPSPHPTEQLIGPLIPASLPRQRPPLLPAIELPPPLPTFGATEPVVLSACRIDASGRISATADAALGWQSGIRLRVDVAHRRLVLRLDDRGIAAVGVRGLIGLPVAARRMLYRTGLPR